MGPPFLRAARPEDSEAGSINYRAARTIPGQVQSIVATPEMIATDARVVLALCSILLHGSRTLGMCRVDPLGRPAHAGWPSGSDAYDELVIHLLQVVYSHLCSEKNLHVVFE